MIRKVISGGQTGVDQAALQAAIDLNINHGGWCPPGRVCEIGEIPDQFVLEETPSDRSPQASDIPHSLRTNWNVRDSDATLLLVDSQSSNSLGTQWTLQCIHNYKKLFYQADLPNIDMRALVGWLETNNITVLNVAGPRESEAPGIYKTAYKITYKLLKTTI